MAGSQTPNLPSDVPEFIPTNSESRISSTGQCGDYVSGLGIPGFKKRGLGLGSRSWIKIDQNWVSKVLELDKTAVMRHCSLPARDLRHLDPMFIYPFSILGREKAIVVILE